MWCEITYPCWLNQLNNVSERGYRVLIILLHINVSSFFMPFRTDCPCWSYLNFDHIYTIKIEKTWTMMTRFYDTINMTTPQWIKYSYLFHRLRIYSLDFTIWLHMMQYFFLAIGLDGIINIDKWVITSRFSVAKMLITNINACRSGLFCFY